MAMLKLAATICVLVGVVGGVAWISRALSGGSDDELDKYFLRDVATAEAIGLPVYWLGREFAVEGLVFRGPYGAEFAAEVEGGISMGYLAPVDGGNVPFGLTTYGRDAWGGVSDRLMNPSLRGVTRKTVTVGGREGDMFFLPLGTRPLNILRLVLDFDTVVVVGTARSTGADYPGEPDSNPFINDPDLLVQVMEDLRPYPE